MKKALLLCAVLLPGLALAAEKAAPKARPNVPGVDWNARTIRATGRGAPALHAPSIAAARIGAEKAAEMDALRNILATLKSVRISSEKTVGEAMTSSDEVKARLEGEAKGFKRVDTRYFSDGGVEIDVEMTLEGVMDELFTEAAPAEKQPAEQVRLPATGEPKNTGLVIDARGLKAQPALAPRLLDEAGREVYAASIVTQDAIRKNGIAGYLSSIEDAKKSARVGDKPLVLKAVKLAGTSDLVLGKADAEKLRDPKANLAWLAEGRVIIVAD